MNRWDVDQLNGESRALATQRLDRLEIRNSRFSNSLADPTASHEVTSHRGFPLHCERVDRSPGTHHW